MYKNFKYILVFVLCFCMFSLNVKALNFPEGECIYKFDKKVFGDYSEDVNKGLWIKIVQDSKNYHYEYKLVDEDWVKANGNKLAIEYTIPGGAYGYINFFILNNDKASFVTDDSVNGYSACPPYAVFDYYENISFSSSKDSYEVYASKDSSSRLIYSEKNKNDYEKRACPENFNWLKEPENPSSDNGYCLYAVHQNDYGCMIIQFNYKSDSVVVNDANFLKWDEIGYINSVYISGDFKKFVKRSGCPSSIGLGPGEGRAPQEKGGDEYKAVGVFIAPVQGKKIIPIKKEDGVLSYDINVTFQLYNALLVKSDPYVSNSIIVGPTKYTNCGEIIGSDMSELLRNIVNVSRILIPILLNVLGIVDFAKAIFSGNEEGMKKAQAKFIKRLIIGVVIFLIPSLLKLVLNVAHKIWPVIDNTLCGIID